MAVVPELDQGQTYLCWLYSVLECFTGAGAPFDWAAVYAQVKGKPYQSPGEPATFDELHRAVAAAGNLTGAQVQWSGADGFIRDDNVREQAVQDGWFVIAGVYE